MRGGSKLDLPYHAREQRSRQRRYKRLARACSAHQTVLHHWVPCGPAIAAVQVCVVGGSLICHTVPEDHNQGKTGTSESLEPVEHVRTTYITESHMVLPLLLYKYAWWEEA